MRRLKTFGTPILKCVFGRTRRLAVSRRAFLAKLAIGCNLVILASAPAQSPMPGGGLQMPTNRLQPTGQAAPVHQIASRSGPQSESPQLRKLFVPAQHARDVATKLSLRYRELPGVTIAPDAANQQLIVMAPPQAQIAIQSDLSRMLASTVKQTSATSAGPLTLRLENISWREFERDLKQAAGQNVPMTTRNNGNQVTFQLNVTPMQGTLIEVDRRQNQVTVRAPDPALPGWQKMIGALDRVPNRYDDITRVHRLTNAEIAPVQRTMRLLRAIRPDSSIGFNPGNFRNAVLQADESSTPPAGQPGPDGRAMADDLEGAGPLGDVQIEYVPELGQIIVKGATRDVQRVMELIKEIESKAELTQPDSDVVPLKHADANAVAELLTQLYEDVLSTRQGDVSITSLDSPNSLLLIGRTEAIAALKELIAKIDQPIEESSRLRVFRLQNASARDAQESILEFFSNRPTIEEDLRNGIGPRVRISADYRTNSLIVSAAPRDMAEVTRLINELDVQQIEATSELRVFNLQNAAAEELATTLSDAFTGAEITGSEDVTAPSTSLRILAVDSDERRLIESGILTGATVTANPGVNAVVVRAPSDSMPLIAELIRQLDQAPGIDSLVKVFTIENGDAAQLTNSLQTLFGEDAGTSGTQIGADNLPIGTAAGESSLVPLRFSTDVRTNSIVASGSASDLEVVESILLRLDSEGFAERITEVVWLQFNDAESIATAVTNYVAQRSQSLQLIQQYQTGLGPFDLLDRDIVAIPEAQSNSLLLSVAPRLYEEVRALIDRLDRRRPMIMIKVLLAEVNLEDTFEIGTELGLQDSLSFSRDQAVGAFPGANAASAATPPTGFNFNSAGVANVNDVARESLAGAAVSTFGLGQTSTLGYGGFVLNAASESVSLLFRTLQDAGRAQLISRPTLMTTDNNEASINVGRLIARFRGNTVAQFGVSPDIEDIPVGVILNIRPRVGRDGLILMEVNVQRSDRDQGNGTLVTDGVGGTVLIEDIIETQVQAVISAYSGQTIIMGGLIQKSRNNFSRRLPYLSNIPVLGNLFKFDFEQESRNELLVVLTPMLVTGEQDLEYIKQVESSKMSWCLADVVEAHGDVGLSGGYGLWGPAIGPTIYPDMQPTVDGEVVVGAVPNGIVVDRPEPIVQPPAASRQMMVPGGSVLESGTLERGLDAPVITTPAIPVEPLPQPMINQSSYRVPTGMIGDETDQTLPASWMKR